MAYTFYNPSYPPFVVVAKANRLKATLTDLLGQRETSRSRIVNERAFPTRVEDSLNENIADMRHQIVSTVSPSGRDSSFLPSPNLPKPPSIQEAACPHTPEQIYNVDQAVWLTSTQNRGNSNGPRRVLGVQEQDDTSRSSFLQARALSAVVPQEIQIRIPSLPGTSTILTADTVDAPGAN